MRPVTSLGCNIRLSRFLQTNSLRQSCSIGLEHKSYSHSETLDFLKEERCHVFNSFAVRYREINNDLDIHLPTGGGGGEGGSRGGGES